MKKRLELLSSFLLLLTAMIWGTAFVAQSVAMDSVGPWTFVFCRFLLAGLILLPISVLSERPYAASLPAPLDPEREKKQSLLGGSCCGLLLGSASITQQLGIVTTTVGKAGFITALYVILVPIFGMLFGRRVRSKTWLCAILGVLGLYLIAIREGSGFSIERGDMLVTVSAVLFSFQIMCVDHFSARVNPVRLSNGQFFGAALVGLLGMLLFEKPEGRNILAAMLPILYAGIFSSAIGYTLQIVGQKYTDPAVASLLMSMEAVFSAVAGWLILGEILRGRELLGCVLLFAAVIFAQLPDRKPGKIGKANIKQM